MRTKMIAPGVLRRLAVWNSGGCPTASEPSIVSRSASYSEPAQMRSSWRNPARPTPTTRPAPAPPPPPQFCRHHRLDVARSATPANSSPSPDPSHTLAASLPPSPHRAVRIIHQPYHSHYHRNPDFHRCRYALSRRIHRISTPGNITQNPLPAPLSRMLGGTESHQ